jgi:RNA polymerase-binding transcription factor DksA
MEVEVVSAQATTRASTEALPYEVVAPLQARLLEQRDAQLARLAAYDVMIAGGAVERVERTMEDAQALAVQATEVLAELDAALGRIDGGTYGTCDGCDDAIPVARLEAIPEARFCVSCQGRRGSGLLS